MQDWIERFLQARRDFEAAGIRTEEQDCSACNGQGCKTCRFTGRIVVPRMRRRVAYTVDGVIVEEWKD